MKGLANAALAEAVAAAGLIPLGLIASCADLGEFNLDVVGSIEAATADFNDIVDQLNRLLSFKAELEALEQELLAIIDRFTAIENAIQECT